MGRPSTRPANRSLFANRFFANIGAGCPSFGGQRTARCARAALRSWSIQRSADASPTPARAARPSAVSEPLAVLEQRYAWVPFTAVSSSNKSVNTNNQRPGFPSVMPLGCVSLALRSTAALRCGRAGTGLVHTASGGAFGCQGKSKLAAVRREISSRFGAVAATARAMSVVRGRLVSSWVRPNPSVERTHNGGARLFAPSRSQAPSCAAHVKR